MIATAGEQHVLGAIAEQARERLVHLGTTLAPPSPSSRPSSSSHSARLVPGQPGEAQQLVAVGHQQRGLRQDQVGERGGDLLARLAEQRRGMQAGLDHQGHVRVVGENLGDHRDVFYTAAEAELECRDRHVLEHRARLHGDQFGRDGPQLVDATGVAHQGGGLHRQGMAAHARQGQDVGRKTAPGRGIARRQAQHARWGLGNGERHGRRKCSADGAQADALR
jgi:hypothetical protein